jgi:outer membrane protein
MRTDECGGKRGCSGGRATGGRGGLNSRSVMAALLMAILFSSSSWAERLSLTEAIALGAENSPSLLESEANRRAADLARREAKGARLPVIEIKEIALRTDSPADAFGLQLMQERFSFPSFVQGDPNRPDPLDNFATEVTASMPLFAGGRISSGIGQASAMAQAAGMIERHTHEAVSLAIAGAYMDALLADRAVDLAAKARETTAKHVDQAQSFFDAGMIVESDLLQAQVQLSRMEEEVIRARNNATVARAGLNRAMGVDQGRSYELDDNLPDLAIDSLGLADAIGRASTLRSDLRASDARTRAASLAVSSARGELLPEIGLLAKYSMNDDRIFGSHGRSYTMMAVARMNIFDGGRSWTRMARSKQEEAAARASHTAYRAQIEFETRQAFHAVREASARRAVAQGAVSAAEKALLIIEDRFGQGIVKVTDLLDAETALNETRLRELQARFDLQRAIRTFHFTTGSSPVPEVTE